MKTNAAVMGFAACALFVATSAMASTVDIPLDAAEFNMSYTHDKYCSIVVTDSEAGILTPSVGTSPNDVKQGVFLINTSYDAAVVFDVDEEWVSLTPWGGEVPQSTEVRVQDRSTGMVSGIARNGQATGRGVTVRPTSTDGVEFGIWMNASNGFKAGVGEAKVTLTGECKEIVLGG